MKGGSPFYISNVLGIPFHAMSEPEAISLFISYLNERPGSNGLTGGPSRCRVVVTPNPEAVMLARRDASFAEAVKNADFRLADGTGIVLASKLTHAPIKTRLRGFDTALGLFAELSLQKRETTAYFLGGAPGTADMPGVAEEAAKKMAESYPSLKIIGFHDGYFSNENEILIIEEIKRLRPEILLVCMGMPRQEMFAYTHRDLPVKLMFCLGGSMDVMSGRVPLAPGLFRRLGLEWLYRLINQPSRAKRMLTLPKFALLVLWRFIRPFTNVEKE
jgi:N-acetylglucosaminyldiphosphoundecaprenol N-acetyl-beta-D-mannosaminyltransferase